MSQLTAAILVGGLGTRLAPVVSDRPKPLAEVAGRPFLDRLLDQLEAAGVRRVVLLTGHLGSRVVAHYGDAYGELMLAYSQEAAPLGTAGALGLALPLVGEGTVLLLNGDSYVDVDLAALVDAHQAFTPHLPHATMTLVSLPDAGRFGRVELGEGARVTRFSEKDGVASPGLVNAGVTLIDFELVSHLTGTEPVSLERELLPAWAAEGRVAGFATTGRFIDIGTPETFAKSQAFFEEG